MKFSWTLALIAINTIIFLAGMGVNLDAFAFTPATALLEPWTMITSIFLHANFSHLMFNMISLLFFGLYLESNIGRSKFLVIYFISGILGNVGYALTASDPFIPGVGASGAIYGVMGTLAILMPFSIVFTFGIPMPMIIAAIVWGVTEYLGFFVPSNIARGAHLAGLFFGVAVGIYLRYMESKRKPIHYVYRIDSM